MLGIIPSFQHSLSNSYQNSTRMTLLIIAAVGPSLPGAALPFNLPKAHTPSCLVMSSRCKVLLCLFCSDVSLPPLLDCPAFRIPSKVILPHHYSFLTLHYLSLNIPHFQYITPCDPLVHHLQLLQSFSLLLQMFHSSFMSVCWFTSKALLAQSIYLAYVLLVLQ